MAAWRHRDIPAGVCDVIVCEAFVGNVILKLYEGVGATLISKVKAGMMQNLRSKIGALLVKPALKATLKSFDASRVRRRTSSWTEGACGEDPRKFQSRRRSRNSIIQCVTVQRAEHQ